MGRVGWGGWDELKIGVGKVESFEYHLGLRNQFCKCGLVIFN